MTKLVRKVRKMDTSIDFLKRKIGGSIMNGDAVLGVLIRYIFVYTSLSTMNIVMNMIYLFHPDTKYHSKYTYYTAIIAICTTPLAFFSLLMSKKLAPGNANFVLPA